MNIFLAPRSNETAHENFLSTIEEGIDYVKIEHFLDEEGKSKLKDQKKLYIWGNKESLKSRWDRMLEDDYVFFYRKRELNYVGQLLYKTFNEELGKFLWPVVDDKPWSCVFMLKNLKQINIPIKTINKLAGYSENFIVQGFQQLNEKGQSNIIKEYDSVDNFISAFSDGKSDTKIIKNNIHENNEILDLLNSKGQIILYGPPGTGKTFFTKELAVKVLS